MKAFLIGSFIGLAIFTANKLGVHGALIGVVSYAVGGVVAMRLYGRRSD